MKVKRSQKRSVIQGWDLSLDHAGIVELVDGKMSRYWVVTKDKKTAAHNADHSYLLICPKDAPKEMKTFYRLNWWREFVPQFLALTRPEHVAIEDYAFNAVGRNTSFGELGSIARLGVLDARSKLRLHDPTTIKLFAARNGAADKPMMERAVDERWGVDFDSTNVPSRKDRTTSEDLADAFAIAQFLWLELCLRNGTTQLKDHGPEDIRCFNRVTKAHPTNLLDRDFLCWADDDEI
jgi:Holliday junction resolvasome RuvABC endonuclease subunit